MTEKWNILIDMQYKFSSLFIYEDLCDLSIISIKLLLILKIRIVIRGDYLNKQKEAKNSG